MRILAAAAAAALVATAVATAGTDPRIVLVKRSPVVVAGSGFAHGASIRVTAAAGALRLSRTVVSSRTGAFVARFARSFGPCDAVVVTAASAHQRATFKTVPVCGADPAP